MDAEPMVKRVEPVAKQKILTVAETRFRWRVIQEPELVVFARSDWANV
jgi:hypothetical protein